MAHPMPGTLVNLTVLEKSIKGEAKLPLIELQNALGQSINYENLNTNFLKNYFFYHIQASTGKLKWLTTTIEKIVVTEDKDSIIGKYKEVIVFFSLKPTELVSVRNFLFEYDVIIHQVINHKIFVSVQEDWLNGIQGQNKAEQIGIIALDIPTGKYYPLQIKLDDGSWYKGTKAMFDLGMEHIKEGTDHLLFLIVLLLPAMLLLKNDQWGSFGGLKFSLFKLIKIITAFTIGHSCTLLVGTLGWVKFPQKPVEIVIALSILISAMHAIKPIFSGKETYIASGFGLFHGLAFSTVLSKLTLTTTTLALSILGFNIGIEVMQICIIAFVFPWLILLSLTPYYQQIKNLLAILASTAAIAWICERFFEKEYFITNVSSHITKYGFWYLLSFSIFSILFYIQTVLLKKRTQ